MDTPNSTEHSMPTPLSRRKAAIVFAALPAQLAEQVCGCLGEQHLAIMQTALASLGAVAPKERDEALQEFVAALKSTQKQAKSQSLANERACSTVADVDLHALQELLQQQHPQVSALLLSRLDPEKGAAVFASLPPEAAVEIGVRMALMQPADVAVVECVDSLLRGASRSSGAGKQDLAPDAHRVLRAGLRYADKEVKRGILNALVDQDRADLAAAIGESLYVFEDLLGLEDRFLQRLLSHVSPVDLAMALKGVSPQSRDAVFRNLSARERSAPRGDRTARTSPSA